jgi:hypothetical protein
MVKVVSVAYDVLVSATNDMTSVAHEGSRDRY